MADTPTNPFEDAFAAAATSLGHDPDEVTGADLILGREEDEDTEEEEVTDQSDEDQDDDDDEGEESDDSDEEDEDDPDADGDEDDDDGEATPDKRYFKIDLSDVPDEVRESVLSELKDKDRYITRQQQEKSALEKEVEELRNLVTEALGSDQDDDAPEFEMPSDEEIIEHITREYDLDPDDAFYEIQVKAALPGFKQALVTEARAQAQSEELDLLRFERQYSSSLSRLESKHGQLPVSHEEFIGWAAQNGFGDDPTDAYDAFMARAQELTGAKAPTKKVDPARAEARRAAKKAAATGGRKPASKTKPSEAKVDSFADAINKAMEQMSMKDDA